LTAEMLIRQSVSRAQDVGGQLVGGVTELVRGSPAITSAVTTGVGLLVTQQVIRRVRKKRTVKKRRKVTRKKRRKVTRRAPRRKKAKRRTHASPRHKGHKVVTFTTKGGKKVRFLTPRKGSKVHKRIKRRRR